MNLWGELSRGGHKKDITKEVVGKYKNIQLRGFMASYCDVYSFHFIAVEKWLCIINTCTKLDETAGNVMVEK